MKSTTQFICSQCGYTSPKWLGRCPDCGSWNSFTEEKIEEKKGLSKESLQCSSTTLSAVAYESEFRFESGISELDRVLGGGIVRCSGRRGTRNRKVHTAFTGCRQLLGSAQGFVCIRRGKCKSGPSACRASGSWT